MPSTEFARVTLGCGSFDALCAADFADRFPPHFHETFAIGIVESGSTRLSTQRGVFVARPGSILAFAPGEVHAAVPLGAYTYRMIYPSAELMREIGVDVGAFRLPVIDDAALGDELASAHRSLMDGAGETRFVSVMRSLSARHPAESANGRGGDGMIVAGTRRYLEERFAEHVRISAIAEMWGVSPFRLIRAFGRAVGVPPYKYLVQLRVNRAQAMLRNGAAVVDVAYACGFSDQAHLTRTFRKVVGVPPGRYLRSVGG